MSHPIHRVASFELLEGYRLRVRFEDGAERTIDLEPVLFGTLYGPLRDPAAISGRAIRRWAAIRAADGRQLRVVLLPDTDTLYIEFKAGDIAETRDFDENTQIDVDARGNLRAITIEHASERADLPAFSYYDGIYEYPRNLGIPES